MSEIQENIETAEVSAPSAEQVPTKRPRVGKQSRQVTPSKAKSGKQAGQAKKPNSVRKSAKSGKNPTASDKASKTAKVLGLLRRSGGATSADLMKATGWQAHSVRGFISGVLGRKMGLKVTSIKVEGEDRHYALKS